jgi:hypothetical protein
VRRGAWTLAAWLAGASAAAQGRPWMDVELGLQASGRHLRYQDDLFGRLNTYDLAAAPGVYGRAAFYPGALGGGRFASMVGVTFAVDGLLAPASRDADGAPVPVRAWGYAAGLRVRLPSPLPDVGLDVGYVAQRFTLGRSTPTLDAGVPNVGAQSLRLGLSGRFGLGRRVALTGRAAWLAVLDTGAAPARYFPRQTVSAVEAAAGVAVDIGEVEVRAGVEYRRYFSSMHPEPGDAYVVGGAVDEYMAATVGFAVRR